jgi:hypothetical protein
MKKSKPKPVKPATATETFDKLTPDIGFLPPKPVLCINCEHHAVVAVHHHHCRSAINLVTGERGEAMCWEMRRANEACGPSGKLFTPK